jgi:hypothetical protein
MLERSTNTLGQNNSQIIFMLKLIIGIITGMKGIGTKGKEPIFPEPSICCKMKELEGGHNSSPVVLTQNKHIKMMSVNAI